MADNRNRNWTMIGYPGDSLPDNYREILNDQLHLSWCESPVHDADVNGNGEEKKPHIHFIIVFKGNKSFEQVLEIAQLLHCPLPKKVENMVGMVRYLIHLDNPEKHQYAREDIKCYGGFSVDEYLARTLTENRQILKDIIQFCIDNGIKEFCDLVDVAMNLENNEWIDVITCRNTLFLSSYLKSKKFKIEEERAQREREESRQRILNRKAEIDAIEQNGI